MPTSHLNQQVRYSDVEYRMDKICIWLYKEIIFMNNDILFLNREWGARYFLTNFEEHFWIARLSYFLDPNMCGFWHICMVLWSQNLVVNYRN